MLPFLSLCSALTLGRPASAFLAAPLSRPAPSAPPLGAAPLLTLIEDLREVYADLDSSPGLAFRRVSSGPPAGRPAALYLPGLDGRGLSAAAQYADLAATFDLHRLTVGVEDRSTFSELTDAVLEFLTDEDLREVTLIGESFGGLLAPAVALRASDRIRALVLVNPATSFDATNWDVWGPALASLRNLPGADGLPTPYSVAGGLTLSALIPDGVQVRRIAGLLFPDITGAAATMLDAEGSWRAMTDGFGILEERLPAATVDWRTRRWLPPGTAAVNPRLDRIQTPTLVLAGKQDRFLPSRKEAARLCRVMPDCTKMELDGGHFLLDDRVNVTALLVDSRLNPLDRPPYDPIVDWRRPPLEEIEQVLGEKVTPLRALVSPVFFSTDQQGRRVRGLSQLPRQEEGKPLLFVGNHQFGGLDLQVLIPELIEQADLDVRGLAHPIIFRGVGGAPGGAPGGTPNAPEGGNLSLFQKFGAVEVTPRNYYRLMQTGQAALLFPGGVREVFHGKDEAYKLFWPEKTDFVRIAAKFNATIIPVSAVGAADSVNILIDPPDMLNLPFGLGERLANSSAAAPIARFDRAEERFVAPFALPNGLPARHYFVFGQPRDAGSVDHRDAEACARLYRETREELERGFDDVLRAREHDPYREAGRRLVEERARGRQAPTFSVELLNRGR